MFVCAGKTENFSFAQSIGIGLVESAINLGKICSYESINSLIFLGTAGSYTQKINLLDIYFSSKGTQLEYSYIFEQSYTPIDNHIELQIQNVSYETNFIVNSSNYIHTDDDFAKKMSGAGIFLENMEFYSVLKIAQIFGIECYGIFCVSNYCNKNAHSDFLKNHQEAKNRLESFVRKNYLL